MEKKKIYICNKDFPNLGLEVGDYFPSEKFTRKAIEDAINKGHITEEIEEEIEKPSSEKINTALHLAKTPGPIYCPICKEYLYSPLDKLSIALFNECSVSLHQSNLDLLIELIKEY